MTQPIYCPGCMYSGQPHLESCEHSNQGILRKQKEQYEWVQLSRLISDLSVSEVLIATEYIRRLIASRPK